jgi:diadenosine tetraphosphate (Ap4A) HIT family hydrolase
MPEEVCPFCEIANSDSHERIILENDQAFLIEDAFPITIGHSLIIPKRHISSFFESTESEKRALLELLGDAKGIASTKHKSSSYNIGINDGLAAGQTVPHLHIHLIPRYEQANTDPRGGVRWVIPEKADYWSQK